MERPNLEMASGLQAAESEFLQPWPHCESVDKTESPVIVLLLQTQEFSKICRSDGVLLCPGGQVQVSKKPIVN